MGVKSAAMDHILHRSIEDRLPIASGGDGPYIIDSQGRRYLDASGGAAVSCLGHNDAAVKAAMHAQIDAIPFAHTGFFTSAPAEALADLLIENAPAGMARVYMVSGGSEAVETALKLARQYHVENGQPQRTRFIARHMSYHGNTLGALSVGHNPARRALYEPILPAAAHVARCNTYRDLGPGESEQDYAARLAAELEAKIHELGPETVIAFVAETVVGATGGVVPPAKGYFQAVRDVCDRHGVLLILDEVMCGMGRTGSLHACEQEGIAPDLMCVAKGLGAGYQPIGALFVSATVFEAVRGGSGAFQHGHTYMGHPIAAAAALAVQQRILGDGLLANVRAMGDLLRARLVDAIGQHPHVGDIRGRGLFWGIELVADRASRTPFDADLKLHARIKRLGLAGGLICYPGGGTADGVAGDHILLAPPFIIEEKHVDEIVGKLSAAIGAALAEAGL